MSEGHTRQPITDLIDKSNALLAWMKSQDIHPIDGIECMTFITARTMAQNYQDRDDLVRNLRAITHYLREVALAEFAAKQAEKGEAS